jgi:hypothetical protein
MIRVKVLQHYLDLNLGLGVGQLDVEVIEAKVIQNHRRVFYFIANCAFSTTQGYAPSRNRTLVRRTTCEYSVDLASRAHILLL